MYKKRFQSLTHSILNIREAQTPTEADSGAMKFEGYAIVFNQPTVLFTDDDGKEYKEIVDSHALDNTDLSDVPMRYNHSMNWILARSRIKTGPGTLLLSIDEHGLKVTGEFIDMQYSRDVYEMIKRGVIDEMSFKFSLTPDDVGYKFDSVTNTTTLLKIDKLFDVSAVDEGAYSKTSISAERSAENAEAEAKAKLESEALERAKLADEKARQEAEAERCRQLSEIGRKLDYELMQSKLC